MTRRMHGVAMLFFLVGTTSACADTVANVAEDEGSTSEASSTTDDGPPTSTTTDGADTGAAESGSTGVEVGNRCGDGIIGGDEQCDDGNLESLDGCSKACLEEFCGDGVMQPPETCDLGAENADDGSCTSVCRENVCGDGLEGPAEGCDDGNTADDDGCGADCTLETCGNGRLEAGETCDDGNRSNDDDCTTLCAPPVCGDGLHSPGRGEACDDGNPDNADACPNDCQDPVCGDGVTEGFEACDDGKANGDGTSLCTASCALNECGDGYLVPALEACDDGASNGDGITECTPACTLNVCGDGYRVLATEGCDAGERNGYVPCSTSCSPVPAVTQVEYSDRSACAVYEDGAVRCWGDPDSGHLAVTEIPDNFVGDEPGEMPPAPAVLGGAVLEVRGSDAGIYGDLWCARRADGGVVCWGSGIGDSYDFHPIEYSGALGPIPFDPDAYPFDFYAIGDEPDELPPTPIPLGGAASALSVGSSSACAITEGALRCWGRGGAPLAYQWPSLGYGETLVVLFEDQFPPPPVNIGVDAVDINHGGTRTCVLGVDQQIRCFGRSEFGLLGQYGTGPVASGTSIDPPPVVDLGGPVERMTRGKSNTCAIDGDDAVRCFGNATDWLHPTGPSIGDDVGELPPPPVPLGPDPIAKVAAGRAGFCSLHNNGDVRCWGGWVTYGYGSEERIGDDPGEMPPPAINLGQPAVDLWVAAARRRICALLEDRSVVCWGQSVFGLETPPQTIGDAPGDMPPPPLRLYE